MTARDRALDDSYDHEGQLDLPWRKVLRPLPRRAVLLLGRCGLQTTWEVCLAVMSGRLQEVSTCAPETLTVLRSMVQRWSAWIDATWPNADNTWRDIPWSIVLPGQSVRVANALLNRGISTFAQVQREVSTRELLRAKNFGNVSLRELRRAVLRVEVLGLDAARWGRRGRPATVFDLVEWCLAFMSPSARLAVHGVVIEGRSAAAVAADLGESRASLQQLLEMPLGRAARRLEDVVHEVVQPVVDGLEDAGGAAGAATVAELSGGETPGRVLLALLIAGEKRYRVLEGTLTGLTDAETRQRVTPARPLWTPRTRKTRGSVTSERGAL